MTLVNGDGIVEIKNTLTGDTLSLNSDMINRLSLAGKLGMSFGGKRDMYAVLGYPTALEADDYYARYARQDVAGKIVDLPAQDTWRRPPVIRDGGKADTEFCLAFQKLARRLKLWNYLERLDRLAGIGHYGVLLIGVKGQSALGQPPPNRLRADDIVYLSPYSEVSAEISAYETDKGNARFGLPVLYTVQLGELGAISLGSAQVHHSRVLHVAEDKLDNDVLGRPRLERVYNLLDDLMKIVGGGAEATWKLIYKGMIISPRDGYKITDSESEMKEKADEFVHGLRRVLVLDGAEANEPKGEVVDPSGLFKIIAGLISAASNIPQRILFGSERGELSSSSDQENWYAQIASRQTTFAEPDIIRPFIDWCLERGALPQPSSGDYDVYWPSLFELTDEEKANIADKRASALQRITTSGALELGVVTIGEARVMVGLPAAPPTGDTIDDLIDMEMREAG